MKNKKKIIIILIIFALLIGIVVLGVGIYSSVSKKKCASNKEEALIRIKNKYGKDLKYEYVGFENDIYKYQVQLESQRNYYMLDIKKCKLSTDHVLNDFLYENYK